MKKFIIHIDSLGPIQHTSIELAPVMIFTGSSNLGKSYTNFLTYYVFNLFSSDRLKDFIRFKIWDGKIKNDEDFFRFSFTTEELQQWMEEDVKNFFAYLLNYPNVPCKVRFQFEGENTTFDISYTKNADIKTDDGFNIILINIDNTNYAIPTVQKSILQATALQIAKHLGNELLGIQIQHSYLLPPGRASLLNESFTVQMLSSKIGMYDIFMRDVDRINNLKMNASKGSNNMDRQSVKQTITTLIEGDLDVNKEKIVLKLDNDTEVPLSAAASSIKELSPLLLWMQTEKFAKDSMCIEEPEAHAHPEMQYDIADLLTICINQGAFMQMTTHSDYLLARLNQHIRMHEVKQNNPDKFDALCKEMHPNDILTLDKEQIGAYYFYKNKDTKKVIVEKQSLKEGIPFSTFANAVQQQIDWDSMLEYNDENE